MEQLFEMHEISSRRLDASLRPLMSFLDISNHLVINVELSLYPDGERNEIVQEIFLVHSCFSLLLNRFCFLYENAARIFLSITGSYLYAPKLSLYSK